MPPELAERYLAEGLWDDRTLGQLLNDALHDDPQRRFRIWSPTNPYIGTVGDVYEQALRVAGGLRAHGLGPGDLVAFQLPNWVEAAVTFYACSIAGRDDRAHRALLRAEGSRLHPPPERGARPRHRLGLRQA